MQTSWLGVMLAFAAMVVTAKTDPARIVLKEKSSSPHDLKISGDVPGMPDGAVRYIGYEQLSALPQVNFNVTDDFNFKVPTKISGVYLADLMHDLDVPKKGILVAAICDDEYEAHYSEDYIEAHRPILVLSLNGKPLAEHVRTRDDGTFGPYLISHASYQPRYHVLAHAEEAQIPNGLVELRFLKENIVLDAIRPHGSFAEDAPEMRGYRIARESCFRCHNSGEYGGLKSGRSWKALAHLAQSNPAGFAAYVKDPVSQDPSAQMPSNPEYDDATLHALTAYFQTFAVAPPQKPASK